MFLLLNNEKYHNQNRSDGPSIPNRKIARYQGEVRGHLDLQSEVQDSQSCYTGNPCLTKPNIKVKEKEKEKIYSEN